MGKELLERPLTNRFREARTPSTSTASSRVRERRSLTSRTCLPLLPSPWNTAPRRMRRSRLLHDAVEDQGGPPTAAAIRQRFGDAVADIVEACSDTEETPKPPWRSRKERYIAHVAGASPSVRLVSACDKLHNARAILGDLRALGEPLWGRFNAEAGRSGVLWYYRALVDAFRKEPMTVRGRSGEAGRARLF